jgi:hypothetical protein
MPRVTYGLIVAAGLFNLAFALFHLFFWRLFKWPQELGRLGMANRGIMQVLNLCLTYLFVVAASMLFLFPGEVVGTDLGRFGLFALTGFWLMRALLQPMFFGWKHRLSAMLFGAFILGALIHGYAWWSVRGI